MQTRTVTCDAQECDGPEPADTKSCTLDPCEWKIGPWDECSTDCGVGLQTRSVTCHNEGQCAEDVKPATNKDCNMPCDDEMLSWHNTELGSWAPWSPCVNGTRFSIFRKGTSYETKPLPDFDNSRHEITSFAGALKLHVDDWKSVYGLPSGSWATDKCVHELWFGDIRELDLTVRYKGHLGDEPLLLKLTTRDPGTAAQKQAYLSGMIGNQLAFMNVPAPPGSMKRIKDKEHNGTNTLKIALRHWDENDPRMEVSVNDEVFMKEFFHFELKRFDVNFLKQYNSLRETEHKILINTPYHAREFAGTKQRPLHLERFLMLDRREDLEDKNNDFTKALAALNKPHTIKIGSDHSKIDEQGLRQSVLDAMRKAAVVAQYYEWDHTVQCTDTRGTYTAGSRVLWLVYVKRVPMALAKNFVIARFKDSFRYRSQKAVANIQVPVVEPTDIAEVQWQAKFVGRKTIRVILEYGGTLTKLTGTVFQLKIHTTDKRPVILDCSVRDGTLVIFGHVADMTRKEYSLGSTLTIQLEMATGGCHEGGCGWGASDALALRLDCRLNKRPLLSTKPAIDITAPVEKVELPHAPHEHLDGVTFVKYKVIAGHQGPSGFSESEDPGDQVWPVGSRSTLMARS